MPGIVDGQATQQTSPRIAPSFMGTNVTFLAKGCECPISLLFWRPVERFQLFNDPASIAPMIVIVPVTPQSRHCFVGCLRHI